MTEHEPPTFQATVEGRTITVKFADAMRLVFPMLTTLTPLELGLAGLAFASLVRDSLQTGRQGLVQFAARGLTGILGELEKRGLTLQAVTAEAMRDLAERALAAAKPAGGEAVN